MKKINILIECSNCSLKRKKPFTWLSEKHLPCPKCGTAIELNQSHITIVKMKMQDALKEVDTVIGSKTITLRV